MSFKEKTVLIRLEDLSLLLIGWLTRVVQTLLGALSISMPKLVKPRFRPRHTGDTDLAITLSLRRCYDRV
jgi:hypothetical protein